jgi:cell division protein FtsW
MDMSITSWFEADMPGRTRRADHIFIACVFLLTGWGLVTLYSSSYAHGLRFFQNGYYFISRQAVLGAAGIFLFFVFSKMNLEKVRKLIPLMVFGTVILCCLTFVPGVGVEKNGATRWIGFGTNPVNPSEPRFTLQPSEFIKLTLPLYLAHIFTKKGEYINSFFKGILPPVLVIGLFFIIVYLQNNFSTALFIAVNALAVFFIAGVQLRWFIGALLVLVPLSALMVLTETHRLIRVMSFFYPTEIDRRGAGYQIFTSLRAINSGELWGKGLGQGTWKIAGIPEVHSDFIFASFAEEMGLMGIALFIILFAAFAAQGYRGAMRNEDKFSQLLGFGLVTMIVSQALVNLAVAVGIMPVTGLPLPFFSAGGTYLLIVLVMAGFIANVSRENVPRVNSRTSRNISGGE